MNPGDTHPEIRRTVQTYVEGMCQGDREKLRAAMHPKACCIGHFEGGLEWDDREAFIAGVMDEVETPDPAPWYRINSLAVTGDMASVAVEDIWLGMHFDDLLTLLNHDGRWVIVSKVFYLRTG
ncbi:MAG: nuclear transport factor 2 family protein [Rhodobacteraceae bacterium]|nr:nuclear transport factor 2 family protein [Paracoccaceae bacterium]